LKGWANANKETVLSFAKTMDPTSVQVRMKYSKKIIKKKKIFKIPKDDPIRKDIQKMPIRKGSILIWNSRLPHGTFPNNSNQ
jgi:ectoine hydroxylase-related dioxygenase (phytanoyl-CoA dioxygenase family)